jgi:crotonobetainyl-CoA:carnitine CoA-transferase CaiB-like acyl-CoA transferase
MAQLINSPQRFARTTSGIHGVVPYRGEHNHDVLSEWLGMDDADIAKLETLGALTPPD